MAKVALLGDVHLGHRKGDKWFEDKQRQFFESLFFPYVNDPKNEIEAVIQTGDLFDTRQSIRHTTMQFVQEVLVPNAKMPWHIGVGNHDMHYKDRIHPNSPDLLLSEYDLFNVYSDFTTINIDGLDIDIIPWICKDNHDFIMAQIRDTDSKLAIGHFELAGFYYYRGLRSDGDDPKFLSKYDKVYSGHFHTQSKAGNIEYIGTPYQLTAGDADDIRGFWVLDTDTMDIEFIENPVQMFTKVYFDADTFDDKNLDRFADMYVKMIVQKRVSEERKIDLDKVIEKIAEVAYDLNVSETLGVDMEDGEVILDIRDTASIIDEAIDDLDEDDDMKVLVRKTFMGLYAEAMN